MNAHTLIVHGLIAQCDEKTRRKIKKESDFLREWLAKDEMRKLVFALISAELTDDTE